MESSAVYETASYLLHGAAIFCAFLTIALAFGIAQTTKNRPRFLLAVAFISGILLITASFFMLVISAKVGYFQASEEGLLEVLIQGGAFLGFAFLVYVSSRLWFTGSAT